MSRRTRSSRAPPPATNKSTSVVDTFVPSVKKEERQADQKLTPKERELIDIVQKDEIPSQQRKARSSKAKGGQNSKSTPIVLTRPQLYSQTLMSKSAALARINLANVPEFIDSEWKLQLNNLGEPWKRVSSNPSVFDSYKQIVALFGEPQHIRKDRSALVWNVPSSIASLPASSYGLLTKKRKWLHDNVVDRVEFRVTSSLVPTTTMEFSYPEMSADQMRSLKTYLNDGQIAYNDEEEVLTVSAPTLFECWVYAGIISGYVTYKIHRRQLRSGEVERRYLQGLGEPFLQDNILEELMTMIEVVQENGTRQPKQLQSALLFGGKDSEDLLTNGLGDLTFEDEDMDVSPYYATSAAAAENEKQHHPHYSHQESLERGKHFLLELNQEK